MSKVRRTFGELRMKTFRFALCIALLALVSVMANADTFNLTITTHYGFTAPATTFGPFGPGPGPDTGWFVITDNSANPFSAAYTLSNDGGPCGGSSSASGTLNSGQSVSFSVSSEGSNCGGFGPNGALLTITGWGADTGINFSIHDADVHSGVFRISPCDGISTDAFVLQGGSPTGCDNGDDFEVSQADGKLVLTSETPEPGSLVLLGSGFLGLAGTLRRKLIA
jgi:hypothetical protein